MATPTKLKKLLKFIPPPENPRCAVGDWERIEGQLGVALPSDYKSVIGAYGSGTFQTFLHLWNYLDLGKKDAKTVIRQITDLFVQDKRDGFDIEFKAFPERGGLIPFVSTNDGNYLCWSTRGTPDRWPVVAYDFGTGRLITAKGLGMLDCLLMLYQKKNPFGDAFCNVDNFDPPVSFVPRSR